MSGQGTSREVWPGGPFPLGADLGRRGHELLALLRARRARRAVPVRRRRDTRSASTCRERTRPQLARLPARRRPRPALRLPRPRAATRREQGHRFNPAKLLHRPLRQGDRGRGRLGRGQRAALHARRHRGRRPRARRRGRRARDPQVGRRRPALRLGGRRAAATPVERDGHLRDPRQGLHQAPPRRCARTCAAPTPGSPPSEAIDLPASAWRHRRRAAAGPPHRRRALPGRPRADATTGATARSATSRRTPRYAATGRARRAGARVQGDGQGAARGRHRGDPRRRLQPHRRGQPPRPDALASGRRQRDLLPPGARRPALLHGLHGHRQHAQRPSPERAAADHGLAALLGHRVHVDGFRFDLASALARELYDVDRLSRLLRRHPPGPGALARSSSSPSPGTSARAATRSATSRCCGASGTACTATTCATSGAAQAQHRASSPRASPAPATSTSPTGASRSPRSTSSPPTTASRCATSSPTTRSTTRPTARTTATAPTTTAPGTAASRATTDDPEICALRARQQRNLLATLLLSQGVPMLLGGDELGRTQHGNNNA